MLIYSLIFIQLKYEHQILKYEQKVLVEGYALKAAGQYADICIAYYESCLKFTPNIELSFAGIKLGTQTDLLLCLIQTVECKMPL